MEVKVNLFAESIVSFSFRYSTRVVRTKFSTLKEAIRYYESREKNTASEKEKTEFKTARWILKKVATVDATLEGVAWNSGILSIYIRYADEETLQYNVKRIVKNHNLTFTQ